MHYSTILFDFDYTLADSSRGIVTCFQHVLNNNKFTDITDDEIKRTIGKTLQESFSILTGIKDPEYLELLRKEYGKEADKYMTVNTYLFPDTEPVLQDLKKKEYKLGIISTKYRFRIKEFLRKHKLESKFDVIIGGEDVTFHKPHPQGLYLAINKLKINSSEVLYIGDSTIDAETAASAGVDFIGVTTGMTTQAELKLYPHKKIITCLSSLLE